MNWVLIVLMANSFGVTSQQTGPYTNSTDCEKAYTVFFEQNTKPDNGWQLSHFCIPVAYTNADTRWTDPLPEEFD